MEAQTIRLSIRDEIALVEEQNPGYKASRGPGDTIIMTPTPELIETQRAKRAQRLAQSAELAHEFDNAVV